MSRSRTPLIAAQSAGVRPRTVTIAMIVVVLVAGGLIIWLLLFRPQQSYDGILFETFSDESTATAVFAGQFPPLDMEPLARPLGIDGDGEHLFITEADDGVISMREYDGSLIETFTIDPAEDAVLFYPVDLAVLSDGRIVVVDTGGTRVIVFDPENPEDSAVFGDRVAGNPTAISVDGGIVAVADAADGTVVLYDEDGEVIEVRGQDVVPPLSFVGGVALGVGGDVVVSDSNAGRIVSLEADESQVVLGQRFSLPRGLEYVLDGRLAVVETFGRYVHLVLKDGQDAESETELVGGTDTERAEEGGTMTAPESLHWDASEQRLYVTDPAEGRIKVYELRESTQ